MLPTIQRMLFLSRSAISVFGSESFCSLRASAVEYVACVVFISARNSVSLPPRAARQLGRRKPRD